MRNTVKFYAAPVVVGGVHARRATSVTADLSEADSLEVLRALLAVHTFELGDSSVIGTVRTRRTGETFAEARISHTAHMGPRGGIIFRAVR